MDIAIEIESRIDLLRNILFNNTNDHARKLLGELVYIYDRMLTARTAKMVSVESIQTKLEEVDLFIDQQDTEAE